MSQTEQPILIERLTLAGALRNGPLSIPNHQREYSWQAARVRKLFDDLNNAMIRRQSSYFLGTVVVTPGKPPKVIDGQQRLATTAIFLAAVRDAFLEMGKDDEAQSVEQDFLYIYDRSRSAHVPRLTMNTDDREYMSERVLKRPKDRTATNPRLHSHRRIDEAARIASGRVSTIVSTADTASRKVEALNAWINFIDESALLVMLEPPNAARAYQMFKTLNDRAQRTTQGDMIKNHLFEKADTKSDEAQSKWSTMRSLIEGVERARGDDPLLRYLHHISIVFNGPLTADEIFERMEENITSQSEAMTFLEALAIYANDYTAILTPSHPKWGDGYDRLVRTYVSNISLEIRLTFIRPVMLAVAAKFSQKETKKAFRVFVSWAMRFLIAGGHTSSRVESAFGIAARDVTHQKITTTEGLIAAASHVIPNDIKFRSAFITKKIANSKLARFILHELESEARGGSPDSLVQPVTDTNLVSLEHVLPKTLGAISGWEHFTAEERKSYRQRIGNLALMDSKDNGAIGDKPFSIKRPVIEKSKNLLLTADILQRTAASGQWTVADIEARQAMMADWAIKRWPIVYSK